MIVSIDTGVMIPLLRPVYVMGMMVGAGVGGGGGGGGAVMEGRRRRRRKRGDMMSD